MIDLKKKLLRFHCKNLLQFRLFQNTFLTFFLLLWLGWSFHTWADSQDEYQFDWLDPDKKIYVLQNRKFIKAQHFSLSLLSGIALSDPYRNTYFFDPRVGYFFSEKWGFEVFYNYLINVQNATFAALKLASSTAIPQIREINQEFGFMVQSIPWYAKINVFNKILHFDWYFGMGGGLIQTNVYSGNKNLNTIQERPQYPSFFLNTGHAYHLNENFDIRFDVKAAIYRAPINGLAGDRAWYASYNFALGCGLKL